MRKNAKHKFTNELSVARISRGLSRKAVAKVLDYSRTTPLTHFEQGSRLPNLTRALQLEIIYRRPVAFLFPELYVSLRNEIRAKEAALKPQTLF
jgi:DNA-binding XRE family transcriptional regulator